ncbi:MAG: TraR/DksA family transcriptional regulator [Smithellaceae bacterium]
MSRDSTRSIEMGQATVGRVSRVDAIQVQQMSLASARRRQGLLSGIEGVLRRIEAGEHGYCFVCAEKIDSRCLEANPTSTCCVNCAKSS